MIGRMLFEKGFIPMKDMPKVSSTKLENAHLLKNVKEEEGDGEAVDEIEVERNDDEEINFSTEYNYLMTLPIWALTYEKVEELKE